MLHRIKTAELRPEWLAHRLENTALAVITCHSTKTGAQPGTGNNFQLPLGFDVADNTELGALSDKCLLVQFGRAGCEWDRIGNAGLTVPQHEVRGSYRLHWAVSVSVLAVVDAADMQHCIPSQGIFRAGVTLSCLNRVAAQHMASLSQAQIERMSFPPKDA